MMERGKKSPPASSSCAMGPVLLCQGSPLVPRVPSSCAKGPSVPSFPRAICTNCFKGGGSMPPSTPPRCHQAGICCQQP